MSANGRLISIKAEANVGRDEAVIDKVCTQRQAEAMALMHLSPEMASFSMSMSNTLLDRLAVERREVYENENGSSSWWQLK